jgi:hypothetical protein
LLDNTSIVFHLVSFFLKIGTLFAKDVHSIYDEVNALCSRKGRQSFEKFQRKKEGFKNFEITEEETIPNGN